MYQYRCDCCGKVIYIDPAEERICGDCQEAREGKPGSRKADMPARESRAGHVLPEPVWQ